jgi:hypothetical protein
LSYTSLLYAITMLMTLPPAAKKKHNLAYMENRKSFLFQMIGLMLIILITLMIDFA